MEDLFDLAAELVALEKRCAAAGFERRIIFDDLHASLCAAAEAKAEAEAGEDEEEA